VDAAPGRLFSTSYSIFSSAKRRGSLSQTRSNKGSLRMDIYSYYHLLYKLHSSDCWHGRTSSVCSFSVLQHQDPRMFTLESALLMQLWASMPVSCL